MRDRTEGRPASEPCQPRDRQGPPRLPPARPPPASERDRLRRATLPRLARFGTVGAAGIVVNNAVLVLLHGLCGVALLPATVVAVEAAIVHNYALHEVWTFRRRR